MQLQKNKITGRAYEGSNQAALLEVKVKEGYLSDEWITYVQARELGKKLVNAKGKGISLRFYVEAFEAVEDSKKLKKVAHPKGFVVFNCDLLEK